MTRPLLEALPMLAERIANANHVLLCLDFDGTLTPLVAHPDIAFVPDSARQLLRELTGATKLTVVIISGRTLVDLQEHVEVPDVILAGNHGLEIKGRGLAFVEPAAEASRAALQDIAADLRTRLEPIPGAFVEDKGLTISVHYRLVEEKQWEAVRRSMHLALAQASHPFLLTVGSMVWEIRPRVYWNKGQVLAWIREQIGKPDALPIYVGDITDEDAFASLAEGVTVMVGAIKESAAQFALNGPAEVETFLAWLLGCLAPKH